MAMVDHLPYTGRGLHAIGARVPPPPLPHLCPSGRRRVHSGLTPCCRAAVPPLSRVFGAKEPLIEI